MALHHLTPDQTIAGRRFSLIRDFDRARLCYRQRCMIDGKPVRRAVWEAEMAEARKAEAQTWRPEDFQAHPSAPQEVPPPDPWGA